MGKIGIYGGSFNPPHLGHMLAAREMAEALGLDRVLLVPAATPPHKDMADGSPSGEQRLEMLRLASEGMEGVEVDGLELRRKGPSYTADTVKALHERYSKDKLYFLMGTDMFLSFHEWYKPEKICKWYFPEAQEERSMLPGRFSQDILRCSPISDSYWILRNFSICFGIR